MANPIIRTQSSLDDPNTQELVANDRDEFSLLIHDASGSALISSTRNGEYHGIAETIPADARIEAVRQW